MEISANGRAGLLSAWVSADCAEEWRCTASLAGLWEPGFKEGRDIEANMEAISDLLLEQVSEN
jgi:hypothetical protein